MGTRLEDLKAQLRELDCERKTLAKDTPRRGELWLQQQELQERIEKETKENERAKCQEVYLKHLTVILKGEDKFDANTSLENIYVCTAGEYSSYRIVAVFRRESDALRFAWTYLSWEPTECISEWPLNKYLSHMNRGLHLFEVLMNKDGEVRRSELDPWDFSDAETPNSITYQAYTGRGRRDGHRLLVRCWAKDEKHAIKITNEIRAQKIANNEWEGNKDEK